MFKKLLFHIRLYGVKFTLRLLGSKFLGLRNPFDDLPPEPLKGTFIGHHLSGCQSMESKTHPIDSIVIPKSNTIQVNLILDRLDDKSDILYLCYELSQKLNGTLRIITRSDYLNPRRFYAMLQPYHVTASESISFFSDYDRTIDGKSRYKLTISDNDIFMCTSLHNAIAAIKTAVDAPVFCLLSDFCLDGEELTSLPYCLNLQNLYFIANRDLAQQLSIPNERLCCPTDNSDHLLNFMELQING